MKIRNVNRPIDLLSIDTDKLNEHYVAKSKIQELSNLNKLYIITNKNTNFGRMYNHEFNLFQFQEKPKIIEETKEEIIDAKDLTIHDINSTNNETNKTDIVKTLQPQVSPIKLEEKKPSMFENKDEKKSSWLENKENLFSFKSKEMAPISNNSPFTINSQQLQNNSTPTSSLTTTEIKKEEVKLKIIKPDVVKEPAAVQVEIKKTYKEMLLNASNKYWEKRSLRKQISDDPLLKKTRDRIMIEIINPNIDQLTGENEITEKANNLIKLLDELYENRSFELYDYTMNYILQKIISKSENYLKEKQTLYVFSKFIFIIKSKHKLLENFFFMILAYKCPYIIPVVFTKKDFPEKEVLMKRLGYSDPDESITTWISNTECYCYLFFGFLSLNDKYFPIISEFLTNIEKMPTDYPMSTTFKVYLNVLGASVKSRIPGGINILKNIVMRFVKELEDLKTKSKSSELKSITSDNIHFIKKYFQNINTGSKTDFYSK